jgi:hypothetical protein
MMIIVRHRLLTFLWVLSLLLFAVLAALIFRSYFVLDQWNRFRGTEVSSLELEHGQLFFMRGTGEVDHGWWDTYRPRPAGGRVVSRTWAPFVSGSMEPQQSAGTQQGRLTYQYYRLSLWWLAAVTAVFPSARAARRVPWRRVLGQRPPGTCRHCGYDLRATPDRCPECGVPARSPVNLSSR